MHTESLITHNISPQLQVLPNADWFTEGGVTPDGKRFGASQHTIIYLPEGGYL